MAMTCELPSANPKPSILLNAVFVALAAVALFFLLTGGIPLLQLSGMTDVSVAKKFSMKSVRLSVLIFIAAAILCGWRFRPLFEGLWIVRAAKWMAALPFRYSVSFLFAVYSSVMIVIGFERHASLDTRAFDLGIFAQAVWNTTQGDFLYSSLKNGICLLGDHVSPILLLLVPLYSVFPDPRLLLVVQPLATAACLFAIAWIAMDRLKERSIALIFVLMFFFYLPSRAALREDFHPEILAEIFILLAFIALEKGRIRWFWFALLPVMAAKENFLGITFFMGAYAGLAKKRWRSGLALMVLSVALFVWEIRWLVPYLSHARYFYGVNYGQCSPAAVGHCLAILTDASRWQYILKIYAPFFFLPLFHPPTFLLTLPVLAQNFLSGNPTLRSLNYHYSAGLTPFLFVSAVYGLKVLTDRFAFVRRRQVLLALAVLAVILTQSAPPEYFFFWRCRTRLTPHTDYIRTRLRSVPPGASVLSHNNFIPQMINRKHIYQLDYNPSPTKGELAKKLSVDYVIFDGAFWEPKTAPVAEALSELKTAGYVIEDEKDGFYRLRKGDT